MDYSLNLLNFAKVCFYEQYNQSYTILDWHKKIAQNLERLIFSENNKNLIICMPPRFGKSELGIKIFISYCLALLPDCNFIVASATLDLARSHVSAIRDIIQSDWYINSFDYGARLKKTGNAGIYKKTARKDYFETIQGGMVKAVGLGGQITGFAAGKRRENDKNIFGGCIVCDDLLKEQDYLSNTQRDLVYSWFKSTIMSRRNTYITPIILIMQRLHDDDIVGRLLREEPNNWNLIKVPALNEETEKSNWEDTISTDALLSLKNSKADIDKYVFYSKYQQEPQTDLSAAIKTSWWKYYSDFDEIQSKIFYRIITIDSAYKAKTYSDESVLQLWGFDSAGEYAYLLDMKHGRWEFPELLQNTKDFFHQSNVYINGKKIQAVYVEDKASGTSLAQTLNREQVPARAWLPKENEPKDKMSRVLECSRYIANGRVFIPKQVSWTQDFKKQCAEFSPEGTTHDDMVDAMTMALMIWRNFGAR